MNANRIFKHFAAVAVVAAFVLQGLALAQHAAGGAGGHAGSAGASGGGAHMGGGMAAGGRGRAGPGYGGYGRWGGYGWGGYGRRGFGWGPGAAWGPGWGWGWAWGWPLGVYIAALPLYYSTFWWDGIPYYYADGGYYVWDDSVGQYQQVQPPPQVAQQATGPASQGQTPQATELFAYPKNGQSDAQQASDKSECRNWAAAQSGFNPAAAAAAASAVHRPDYLRAEAACLEGRGYSVE